MKNEKINLKNYLPIVKPFVINKYEFKFTIFIPVYNGEKTIIRALKGIEEQTFRDFEVLIINDGSKDATSLVVRDYLSKSDLSLTFIDNNENQHKLGVISQAIKIAKGEFFLIHDADDASLPNALQIYFDEYGNIPDSKKENISGVTARCIDQYGDIIGQRFDYDPFYSNSFELPYYHNIIGEKWGFVKTDILKSIYINNSLFKKGLIPEGYLWLTIAKEGYQTKYINEVTRVYYLNEANSLSSNKYNQKAFGITVYCILFINYFSSKHLYKKPIIFVKRLISILLASNYLNYNLKTYYDAIDNNLLKITLILLWPFRKLTKFLE